MSIDDNFAQRFLKPCEYRWLCQLSVLVHEEFLVPVLRHPDLIRLSIQIYEWLAFAIFVYHFKHEFCIGPSDVVVELMLEGVQHFLSLHLVSFWLYLLHFLIQDSMPHHLLLVFRGVFVFARVAFTLVFLIFTRLA